MPSKSSELTYWFGFDRSIPVPYDQLKRRVTKTTHISKYNQMNTTKASTLSGPFLKALDVYYDLTVNEKNRGALGFSQNGFAAEYVSSTGAQHAAWYNASNGDLKIGVRKAGETVLSPYDINEKAYDGTVIWLSMIQKLRDDAEFYSSLMTFCAHSTLTDDKIQAAYILCDNAYRRIADGSVCFDPKPVLLSSEECRNLKPFRVCGRFELIASVEQLGDTSGEPSKQTDKGTSSSLEKAPKQFSPGAYAMNPNRVLTEMERQLVPRLKNEFTVSEEAKEICTLAYLTASTPNPFKNFMLFGPAGTGKTSSAVAVAAGLGLPYTLVTCSPETEKMDLLGQILPASVKGGKTLDLPDAEQIEFDPEEAYYQITGERKDDVASIDCIEAILAKVNQLQPTDGYYFQESELMKALKYGWIVELQEPTTITNPAALTCLNSIFDPEGMITLPNGEIIRRHPDCVIIITTNLSYEGCRSLNQAVLDRIQFSKYIALPPKEVMVQRGMKKTGCTDFAMVDKMADVIIAAEKFCANNFYDGVVGMRSFFNWITQTMIYKDPYQCALSTVISKAATSIEDQKTLAESVLENTFGKNGKNAVKRR